jgi:hypothetical protein
MIPGTTNGILREVLRSAENGRCVEWCEVSLGKKCFREWRRCIYIV